MYSVRDAMRSVSHWMRVKMCPCGCSSQCSNAFNVKQETGLGLEPNTLQGNGKLLKAKVQTVARPLAPSPLEEWSGAQNYRHQSAAFSQMSLASPGPPLLQQSLSFHSSSLTHPRTTVSRRLAQALVKDAAEARNHKS